MKDKWWDKRSDPELTITAVDPDAYLYKTVMKIEKPDGSVLFIEPNEKGELLWTIDIEGAEVSVVTERTLKP